jgi:hypothetical protein
VFCPECEEATPLEDICRTCGACDICCECEAASFDSDEFGEDPEAEFERRFL